MRRINTFDAKLKLKTEPNLTMSPGSEFKILTTRSTETFNTYACSVDWHLLESLYLCPGVS